MPTVCIQCNLRALVEGRPPEAFDGTIEQHMRQFHPDPEATRRERAELERKASDKLGRRPHDRL